MTRIARLLTIVCLVLGMAAMRVAPVHATTQTLTVTNCSGAFIQGSLPTAVITANSDVGDTITFAQDCSGASKITLAGSLNIVGAMKIDGSGHHIVIDGGNSVGLVQVQQTGAIQLNHLTLQHGSTSNGGAIFNFGGTTTVANSTISNNVSNGGGGAIFNFGALTITNSSLSGNSSTFGDGGAILNNNGLTITNSTLSGNSAIGGGAIFNDTSTAIATVGGTVVANSRGGNCAGPGAITDQGYNLEDDSGASCGFSSAKNDIVGQNPLLDPLAAYGGPTHTMALQPGSPAIDQIPAGNSLCPATDQRGLPRPDNGETTCDIGAVEINDAAQTSPTLTTTASPASVTLDASGSPTLNDTAILSGGNNPTGTITFTLMSPTNTPVFTDDVPVNGNGSYATSGGDNAGGFTLPTSGTVAGTYIWAGSYSGDGGNNEAQDTGQNEQTVVSAASPALSTTPSMAGSGTLIDSATLSSGYFPTGTLTFYLLPPGSSSSTPLSSAVYTDAVTVSGNGSYDTTMGANPGGFSPSVSGTYNWVAVYSGDGNNSSVTSPFGSETVTVTPTPTDTPTAAPTDTLTTTPTDTPIPTSTPTDTPIPTDTPTNTPVPPTETPVPPTSTPTETPTTAPTNTPVPPTDTPTPTGNQTLIVTDCSQESGSGTLGDAITQADAVSGDTITFACSGSIPITSTLAVTKDMTIDGSGQTVTLDGGGSTQLLDISNTSCCPHVALNHLTFADGETTSDGGAISADAYLTISNSAFSGNTASEGGAIDAFGSVLTVSNSTFTNNSASADGGAIALGFQITIDSSSFTGNSSPSGGALYVNDGETATVSNSTLSANTASSSGGALFNIGSTTVQTSTLAGNTACAGGAIDNPNLLGLPQPPDLTVLNSTVAGNTATCLDANDGGGIRNGPPTFSGGSASVLTAGGSIVAGNTTNGTPGNCSNQGTLVDDSYNLESGTDCGFTQPGDLQNTDPNLAALGDNGGPTQTMALEAGSPAIDAILLTYDLPSTTTPLCPPTDQRDVTRPDDGESACDIGAYEYNGVDVTPSPTPTNAPTNTPTSTPTETPTITPAATDTPTDTPVPTDTPTDTPIPTNTPTDTPVPTDTPTQTAVPTDTPTDTPTSTATATLTPTATPTGTPSALHLVLTYPSSATAGTAFNVTVTAYDQNNNRDTAYRGTVSFSSSDLSARLQGKYTFSSRDTGSHTFNVTLMTAGLQTVSVTDNTPASAGGPLTASTMPPITVLPATLTSFQVSAAGNTVTAGNPFRLTVTALDKFGNTVSSYTGKIHVASSDKQVSAGNGLPDDYTFTSCLSGCDNGTHIFYNPTTPPYDVVLKAAGKQTITVNDTTTTSIKGIITLAVSPAATSTFLLKTPVKVKHGTSFSFTVTAQDAYGNSTPGYGGMVTFSSSAGSNAVLPAPYQFTAADKGIHTFNAKLAVGGTFTITVMDTVTPSITGTSPPITVT